MGGQCHLRTQYDNYEEFAAYSEMYGIAYRLGFRNEAEAWAANPVIQVSVNPGDLRVVPTKEPVSKKRSRGRFKK